MKIKIVLLTCVFAVISMVAFASEMKSTSRDLKVIAAEPKVPNVPNEIEIIREVIKTKVFEDEIEPIIEIPPLDELYLEELEAALNTKDYNNIKAFINLSDFFVIDWCQNLVTTKTSLENKWQDLQGKAGFDTWRNSIKLNFIKQLSPLVTVISTNIEVVGEKGRIFNGSAMIITEFMDDSWRVIGVNISEIPEQKQAINLNIAHYVMMIIGAFLMLVLFWKLVSRKAV